MTESVKTLISTRAETIARLLQVDAFFLDTVYASLASTHTPVIPTKEKAVDFIDHTLLRFDATEKDIEKLCEEAAYHSFKSVCVQPLWVFKAKDMRKALQANYLITTVVDFPSGALSDHVRIEEAEYALKSGVEEIDVVINIGLIKSGLLEQAYHLMKSVIDIGVYTKTILETSALSIHEKIDAALIALCAGTHMFKTSTGLFGKATEDDVRLLRMIAGESIGVKASGGISTPEMFKSMIDAGADRIGTSSSVHIMNTWQ